MTRPPPYAKLGPSMNKREQKAYLAQAYDSAESTGERLTQPRRDVLGIIAASDKPIGAYDILASLSKTMDNPKPPTAYRAIDFWLEQGWIHKIESLNAFVPCSAGHRHHGSQFMVCAQCHDVIETHLCDLPQTLAAQADKQSFRVRRWNVELHGLCRKCQ